MPKMKTHRGLAKRVKKTGQGKLKRARAFHSHLLSSKSPKRKRNLSQSRIVHPSDAKRIEKLVPYL
jgi:large subunit ribosomal protein L35